MSDSKKPAKPKQSAKEERLAKALRENLKRRKAQARAREDDGGGPKGVEKPKT